MSASHDLQKYRTQWTEQLVVGLAGLRLDVGPEQQELLLDYLALLAKWNRAFNLTAVRNPGEMVTRQLLDSLSIYPFVKGPRILDVGTGAGLPGIPLAIVLPQFDFTLLDTNGKKTRFVRQAKAELGLSNVTVIQQRVEEYSPGRRYDTITSRAFASLGDMLAGTRHLLAEQGQWLAMKGLVPEDEIAALPVGYKIGVEALKVPGESGQRHAIIIRNS